MRMNRDSVSISLVSSNVPVWSRLNDYFVSFYDDSDVFSYFEG
jgi:hypothetical protein